MPGVTTGAVTFRNGGDGSVSDDFYVTAPSELTTPDVTRFLLWDRRQNYRNPTTLRGALESETITQTFPPVISPDGGFITAEPVEVTITCDTPSSTIRYTTNGSTPTSGSTLYTAPFDVSVTTTVKARAFSSLTDSPVTEATFTLIPPSAPEPQTGFRVRAAGRL